MSNLRKMIGQMLVMGFSGYEIIKGSPVVHWLERDGLGGVILFDYDFQAQQFGKNLKSKAQIKALTDSLRSHLDDDALPLFVAIDYEGGDIDRLAKIDGCMTTLSPVKQAALADHDLYVEAERMAITLKELGFNLNFAPVVDLNLNDQIGIIGKRGRSFSADPEKVARAAKLFVKAFANHGVACCYKHFPGHGSAIGDTHEGFVDVTETYQPQELEPYKKLTKDSQKPAMIMTAHVINKQLDSQGLPATLSYPVLTELLRDELGFDGIIISDDLQMHAISNHFSTKEALKLTINAGADMMIFGNQLGNHDATEIVDMVEQLVISGEVAEARITESYQRIVTFKQAYDLT